ncbi:hypothetical protein GGS23DRAFT_585738 [Durotheca rogersii]|uniref:uncharacterized protein n=1 Tax=Durotheca rogersii TaxID=419775 RepID=UPI002220E768|nr:uncharacterized protein GGS23DRAFT_585738 [Durotheca rogersii]KAI5859514.1 hypothetical protein GGS23DRAFT_585738 [Durotheca rogersii]
MAPRSGNRHSPYDDPYVFDDPYRRSTSPIKSAAYEYVGTDEPPTQSKSRASSPDSAHHWHASLPKKYSSTATPPRHSRRSRAHSPSPPADTSKRPTSTRTSRRDLASSRPTEKEATRARQHKDQDSNKRPPLKSSKSFGEQGLKFLGEAAALYAAATAGSANRGRSPSRDRSHRSSHRDSKSGGRHHHRRYSPSPSVSPPKRRSRAYSDEPPRRHRSSRSVASDDSDHHRDRGRDHRRSRASAYTPSPSRSPSRHRHSRHAKSASSSLQPSRRDGHSKKPDEATALKWQTAARAALEAGGLAALRLRKEPGSWTGEKGAKIATAALGAAAIDALIDKDPRRTKSSGVKGFAETAITGLIASRLTGVKGSSSHRSRF